MLMKCSDLWNLFSSETLNSSGEYLVVKPYFSIDLFNFDIVVQSNLTDFDWFNLFLDLLSL